MTSTDRLPERVDRWFSIRHPVSYWSFWRDLLRLAPVLVGLFALVVATVGTRFSVVTFAPLPYVFVAATAGYAIRDLNFLGGFWSLLLAAAYSFVLGVTEVGWVLLMRPTPVLKAVAILTFVALVAGFTAPSLHGRLENEGLEAAYRQHRRKDS